MRVFMYFGDIKRELVALNPLSGNPGVGGTHWLFLMLSYLLPRSSAKYDVTVMSESPLTLDPRVRVLRIDEAPAVVAQREGADVLLMRSDASEETRRSIEQSRLKVVLWSHNYVLEDFARWVVRTPQVVANVFVGRQMYDRYVDDDLITKSVCIPNMLPVQDVCANRVNDSATVVFMGALVPVKGFHALAKIWKGILREVPDAKLKVIGSANLYRSGTKLGSLGVASEAYEKVFRRHICDDRGELLPSVEFLGALGEEKRDVFLRASVGVINPTARTESFSISVLEMNTFGLPVVTRNDMSFPDVVRDGETGILRSSMRGIKRGIVELLKDSRKNEELGRSAMAFAKEFSPERTMPLWTALFDDVANGRFSADYQPPTGHYRNMHKWVRMANRFVRFRLGLKFFPSILAYESVVRVAMRRLGLRR